MSKSSVRPTEERWQLRRQRRTAELIEAIREDEQRLGRTMSRGEREGFCKGFLGADPSAEVMWQEALALVEGTDPE